MLSNPKLTSIDFGDLFCQITYNLSLIQGKENSSSPQEHSSLDALKVSSLFRGVVRMADRSKTLRLGRSLLM